MTHLGSKWVILVRNRTNLGPFQIRFGSPSQNVLKSDPKKIPDLSHLGPIWPTWDLNLVLFFVDKKFISRFTLLNMSISEFRFDCTVWLDYQKFNFKFYHNNRVFWTLQLRRYWMKRNNFWQNYTWEICFLGWLKKIIKGVHLLMFFTMFCFSSYDSGKVDNHENKQYLADSFLLIDHSSI